MYQPTLARFMSRDRRPVNGVDILYPMPNMRFARRAPQGYVYVSNNPINLADPSGLMALANVLAGFLQTAPIGKKSTVTLDCPGYGCTGGPCKFELSFEPKAGPNGALAAGTKICIRQYPGEYDPDVRPRPKDLPSDTCESEINRNVKKTDHITVILGDGTECKFTQDVFPPNESWPPIPGRVPPACEQIFRIEGPRLPRGAPSQGACYVTTNDVQSISLRFTLDIACFCKTCLGFGENRDTIEISASAP